MSYHPPIPQILLAMQTAGSLDQGVLSISDAQSILDEAGRFAAERIAPLNRVGDTHPARLLNGEVLTPPGWRDTYRDWCAAGWNGLTGHVEFGGQGLPMLLSAACTEIWSAANLAFSLCPLLTTGAIEAVTAHASATVKQRYLPKLISGEWSGTMNLTEPQSGSDLSQLRCKAVRHGDGSYRITGTKIYITYGEHDCTENIIHLVLARLEDAPAGTKGISLFLVPKTLPDGTRNDLRCHSLENKLGIHGSPTCTMIYGDSGGATGWLIGEENRGLNCMFTMMNNARLLVGVQGVAIASRATQAAFAYARERKQGRSAHSGDAQSAIIHHPDVKRMLLEMRAKTSAARILCMATAAALDGGPKHAAQAALLTPLAKSYATDVAVEVASLAVQVHGGMGFIEDTGVAQYYRDARILPIYEGTNGIQAIDLVTRKLGQDNGATLAELLRNCETAVGAEIVSKVRDLAHGIGVAPASAESLAVATAFTRALSVVVAAGYLRKASVLAQGTGLAEETGLEERYFIATEVASAVATAQAAANAAALVTGTNFE